MLYITFFVQAHLLVSPDAASNMDVLNWADTEQIKLDFFPLNWSSPANFGGQIFSRSAVDAEPD